MGLISGLLAPGIFGAEMDDVGQAVPLHLQEEILVAQAGAKRRRDFALGRACARAALAALGQEDAAIGRSENGVPLWPAGVLGSITHTKGYAAALVAGAGHVRGLGIDAERVGGVTRDLWPRLFDVAECDYLSETDVRQQQVFATLFFSAKEAVYKASGTQSGLPFRAIHITPEERGFTATWSGKLLRGRYVLRDDLIVTAVWF
jgi:4'-phosphopantetheinyl transferase EntD